MNQFVKILIALFCLSFATNANSQDESSSSGGSASGFRVSPQIATIFPTFLGVGASLILNENYELNLMYGTTPEPYHETIASVAADLADDQSYEGVINSAFQDNQTLRAAFNYNFKSSREGWNIGLSFSYLSSEGQAGIDDVLSAVTGRDFSGLRTILINRGRDPEVDLDSELTVAELNFGYRWPVSTRLTFGASAGAIKVLSADMKIKTGLPNFEASPAGSSLLRSTESDLEEIVVENGISPVIGVSLSYNF
jgi:hypothetical protein